MSGTEKQEEWEDDVKKIKNSGQGHVTKLLHGYHGWGTERRFRGGGEGKNRKLARGEKGGTHRSAMVWAM